MSLAARLSRVAVAGNDPQTAQLNDVQEYAIPVLQQLLTRS